MSPHNIVDRTITIQIEAKIVRACSGSVTGTPNLSVCADVRLTLSFSIQALRFSVSYGIDEKPYWNATKRTAMGQQSEVFRIKPMTAPNALFVW